MRPATPVSLFGALLLCACVHAPGATRPPGYPGTWEVASLRAWLGGGLIEMTPSGGAAVGQDGREHQYAATGTLALAPDGACRFLLDVRLDGAPPGRSERGCTWRTEGSRLLLIDQGGAVTLYQVESAGGGLLLEAMTSAGADGEEWPTGERMTLLPAQTSAPFAAKPESDESGDGSL